MKNIGKITIVFIAAFLFVSANAFAQNEGDGFKLPNYEKYILDNGLTLYLMEQHEVPLIYISTIFPAGAVWDGEKSGLAAMTAEALLFGTKSYTKKQIEETFDFLGANIYAYAGKEAAQLFLSFKKDDTGKILPIFKEVLLSPTFPEKEIEKRKQRWLVELDQAKESPRSVINSYFEKLLFDGNVYGNPVDGKKSSIAKLTVDDIKEFYQTHYLLNSSAIAVVGDFNSAEMKKKIEDMFKLVASPLDKHIPELNTKEIQPVEKSRVLLVNKDDSHETTFYIGSFGVPMNNPDLVQIQVVNTILGGRFTSWLNDELRVNAGLTYGARSRFVNYKSAGTFYISSFTATPTTVDAIDLALEVLNRLHTKGIDEATLTSAKNYIKGQFPPRFETSGDLADLLTKMYFYGLDDSYINDFEKKVDGMTVEKANEIIAKYFPKENLQFVLIGKADEIRDKVKKYGEVTEKNIEEDEF